MKQHIFFIDGYECEVEIVDTHSLFCCATIWKSSDDAIGVEFFLPDINAIETGIYYTWDYVNECPQEHKFGYNPYANGFEYCLTELEYYLTNVAAWKPLEL